MTISTTANRASAAGNGSTTAFSFPYLFFTDADLKVILVVDSTGVETVKTISTHYTVAGAGVAAGGTVTMGSAPASGETLVIIREEQFTQGLDLIENDPFPSELVEKQFDILTMLAQQLNDAAGRTVKLSDGDTSGADPTLATPVADAFLKWNAAGDALTSSTTSAGQSLGGNGTVSLPYYSFTSDPDSGMYRIGANNIGFAVNGAKVLDLDTSGINGAIGATTAATGAFTTLAASSTTALTGILTMGANIVSDTDSTDDLGTTGVRWANLWVDAITVTNNQTISGNMTIAGNLTVNGTTVTLDATNTIVKDPLMELNTGASSNANDLGFIMERGSTGDNAFMGWDESGDYFAFGTTTATGSSTGNITYTLAQARFAGLNLSGTSADLGTVTTISVVGGTIDGAVIGGSTAAAVTGTTLTANTSITLATGGAMTGVLDSDAMSGTSAALLSTSESIKAYVDNTAKAPGLQMTWETTTTDTDQGVGKVWASAGSFTPGSDYTLYFDDVERNSVSINALIDSLDDPTATNSATIYIQEAGSASAGLVFLVNGSVTSASTYSKVAVEHVATFGTLSDGDVVGVTIAFSGDNGGGMANVVEDTSPQLGAALDTNAFSIQQSEGAAVVAATRPNIWATDGDTIHITGATQIDDFADAPDFGIWKHLIFDAGPVVTHGSGITVVGGTQTMAAGDHMYVYADAVDAFRAFISKADGTAVVAGAGGKLSAVGLITHAGDTALVTQASGGSQMGSHVTLTIPSAGVVRITPLVLEYDETDGAAGSAGIGLKVGSDSIIWAQFAVSGTATLKFNYALYAASSVADILQPLGYSIGEGQSGPLEGSYSFDIVHHSLNAGSQEVEVWLGDNINSTTGEITVTGCSVTARFLVEVIDGS